MKGSGETGWLPSQTSSLWEVSKWTFNVYTVGESWPSYWWKLVQQEQRGYNIIKKKIIYLKGILKRLHMIILEHYRHDGIMTDVVGNFYSEIEWIRQKDI